MQRQLLTSSHKVMDTHLISEQWLPPQNPLPSVFIAEREMEYPTGQSGSAVLAVSPPNFLCTPSILAGEQSRTRESTAAVQAPLSNSQNTGVLKILF